MTVLLMAPVIDIIYLTFSDEHERLTQKINSCIAASLTLSGRWEDINNYASCLCLTARVCISVYSISSPSSALEQRRKLTIVDSVSSVMSNSLLCGVCVVGVSTHLQLHVFVNGRGQSALALTFGNELSAGFSFVFMCIYKREYHDVCACTASVHV